MNIHDLIANPPKLHVECGKLVSGWKLADEELLFLDRQVTEGMKTIETGAGISTIVFAIKGVAHTCIVPDDEQVNRIRLYCNEHHISHANINFIIDRSEHALPRLENKNFDLALIDGRHGFPAPFIDWFYMADLLKIGGILIIDDLHIWTCELLMQFLVSEEEWSLLKETLSAAIFVKRGNNVQHKDWVNQVFVLSQSRQVSLAAKARYLLNLLKRKNLSLFWSAISLGISSAIEGRFGERGRR
ncbi:MAG: class I SAM-dependent methyltransferase [Thermodesulfobacteriota bacterium]|jgi:hypothetical protein